MVRGRARRPYLGFLMIPLVDSLLRGNFATTTVSSGNTLFVVIASHLPCRILKKVSLSPDSQAVVEASSSISTGQELHHLAIVGDEIFVSFKQARDVENGQHRGTISKLCSHSLVRIGDIYESRGVLKAMVGHKGLLYLLYGTDAYEPVGGDDHLIRVITPGGDVVKDFDVGHSTRPLDMKIFEDHIYVLAAIWTRCDDDDDDDGDDELSDAAGASTTASSSVSHSKSQARARYWELPACSITYSAASTKTASPTTHSARLPPSSHGVEPPAPCVASSQPARPPRCLLRLRLLGLVGRAAASAAAAMRVTAAIAAENVGEPLGFRRDVHSARPRAT